MYLFNLPYTNTILEIVKISLGPVSALFAVYLTNRSNNKRIKIENENKAKINKLKKMTRYREKLYYALLIYELMYQRYHNIQSRVYLGNKISNSLLQIFIKDRDRLQSQAVRIRMIIDIYYRNELEKSSNIFNNSKDELQKKMNDISEKEILPLNREKDAEYLELYNQHFESIQKMKTEIKNISIK
jgi:hypothetical protein